MTFTVANLYYNQPILTVLADDFKVTHERVSLIPTLTQAGYAFGLVLICPLGDMFRRRPLVLLLVFVTATLWIGLLITKNFTAFAVLTFLVYFLEVTPQLMMPLVAEYAPPARRGQSLAICFSGVGLGILLARLLSGVISSSSPWRNIYRIALALQYLIVALLYLFMPDYPSANPTGLTYLRVLASIPPLPFRHPVLAQAVVATFLTSAVMLNFWTTLTFLLSSPLYSYSTLQIGLFALIGIAAMLTTPLLGRYLVDAYVPLFAAILVSVFQLVTQIIGAYAGRRSIGALVVQAIGIDICFQIQQTALRAGFHRVELKMHSRVNTAFVTCVFAGMMTGTTVGAKLYTSHGGWIASGSAGVGFAGASLCVLLARGPWEKGWAGWGGGISIRSREVEAPSPSAQPLDEEEGIGDDGQKSLSGSRDDPVGLCADPEKEASSHI